MQLLRIWVVHGATLIDEVWLVSNQLPSRLMKIDGSRLCRLQYVAVMLSDGRSY